ncbi:tetratricopeptide repeat protein [Ruminococcus sp. OA3]|uniref:tetratricopeptide repeat protein n=1 Tax=Ruminococcus sp. OA3 TaxID=2914164 RepID=UPI001F067475|nr:tetratricopeptide repeat protein [Ruminococcus sp. OA3]MCH1983908.1 tetratricopeptide repeat protein [Ruminococcus sp. OA3]
MSEKQAIGISEWNTKEFYHQLGTQYRTHDMQRIEQFLAGCARQLEEKQKNPILCCMVYNEMGSFYRGTSRYQDSLLAFRKSQKLILELKGKDTVEYAASINNMAGTYRLMGEHKQAVSLFQEALNIHERMGDCQSYAYASVHNNLALACQELGQLSRAASHLETALPLIENMPGHGHEVAVTETNLGILYHRMGETTKGHQCIARALKIFEELDDEKNVHYAAALNMLGTFCYESGEYGQAAAAYKKAAEYTERFFGRNAEYEIACRNLSRASEKLEEGPVI